MRKTVRRNKGILTRAAFIDTCVFISTVLKDEDTRYCKSFLARIKNGVVKGYISPYVVGEMTGAISQDKDLSSAKKIDLIYSIFDAIETSRVVYYWFDDNTIKNYQELRSSDECLSYADVLHCACAQVLSVPLVTTDTQLILSKGISDAIKVIHPKEFLKQLRR